MKTQYRSIAVTGWAVVFGVALVLASLMLGGCGKKEEPSGLSDISGLWVWSEASIKSYEAQDKLLDFCEKHKFNRLLAQVHFISESIRTSAPVLKYPGALSRLIKEAGLRGIVVEALGGDPTMAAPHNQIDAVKMMDAILRFNASLPSDSRLVGLHLDIEPYLAKGWNTPAREQMMRDVLMFLMMVNGRLRLAAPEMTLACDIPFWYDQRTAPGDTCVLEFLGQKKNFHEHIQDMADYVAVMSYRRKVEGSNSITGIVENEIKYAEKIGRVICVCLETMDLEDSSATTSFHGLPAAELWRQKENTEAYLSDKQGFAGVLVHSYEALAKMTEQDGGKSH